MPADPRVANGTCSKVVGSQFQFDGTYAQPYMTGGAGAGLPKASATSLYGHWPTVSISNVGSGSSAVAASLLYAYTPTKSIVTLPTATFTVVERGSTVTATASGGGDGWFDTSDTTSFVTTISGCSYIDGWNAAGSPAPASVCTGSPIARRFAEATITPSL